MSDDSPRPVVRLPLQTGASALRDVVAATLAGAGVAWLGVAVFAGGIGGGVAAGSVSIFFLGPLIGVAVMGAALSAWISGLVSARMHRASDLELDADGFAIQGGRKHGFAARFAELKPSDCTLEPAVSGAIRKYLGQTNYRRAFYIKAQGDFHLVAETADLDEEASVTGLIEAIEARIGGPPPAPARDRPVIVVLCAACGAPVQPIDAHDGPCAHCGARAAMPEQVRERLRQADAEGGAHAALERTVARIVAQPGATRVNGSLALVGTTFAVASVAAPIVALTRGVPAALVFVAASLASLWAARAQIERRRALRELTLRFAARVDAAGVSHCRSCLGALPGGTAVVARCVYCGAANVRGLDFGQRALVEQSTARELASDVGRRTMRARLYWAFASASLILAVVLSLVARR